MLSKQILTVAEGKTGTITVQLAKAPATNLRVGVARLLSDPSVTVTRASFDFSPSNWNRPKALTIAAAEDNDLNDDGATIVLSASGVPAARIVATALDNDRPAGSPSAVISLPRNGDVVSGTNAEFFGDARGPAVKAQFYVDGVLRYTDRNTVGHYHINGEHNRWDTTQLTNGVHVLLMRVTDATGKWGAHRIKVIVAN